MVDSIGARLKRAARLAGLSMRKLDTLAGRPGSGLAQKWASNPERSIDADILGAYARVLGLSLDYLVSGRGERPSASALGAAALAAAKSRKRCCHVRDLTVAAAPRKRSVRSATANRSTAE